MLSTLSISTRLVTHTHVMFVLFYRRHTVSDGRGAQTDPGAAGGRGKTPLNH